MELNFQQTMNQSTADEHYHHRWLITQDIGFYDENGLIYLHGQYRYSSMELTSIVQQSRIESYLLNHPLIAEAYVIETTTGKCAALVALKFVNTHLTPELNQQIVDYIKGIAINSSDLGFGKKILLILIIYIHIKFRKCC